MPAFYWKTATQLAALIRAGQLSASEVVEAHLERIAERNPALNAIVTLDADGARARAAEADAALARGERWGPLHGVPLTVKDALETAGMRTTGGYEPLSDYVPQRDATVVARLRSAGAILLGKTNLPVLSGDYQAVNPIFGRTNNPWNLERVPGGSSGGSAATVAAGLVPLELGSDYSGSIRVPAHYCGVYGLRPTEHRVPMTGHIPTLPGKPHSTRHINTIGPFARSVDDIELALRIIAGPDGHDWNVPPVTLEASTSPPLSSLRLAVTDDFGVPVSADTRTAFARLAADLVQAGARVEHVDPRAFGFDPAVAWEIFGEIAQAEYGAGMQPDEELEIIRAFRANRTDDDPMGRGMEAAVGASLRFYTGTLIRRDALVRALHAAFATGGWDALLTPVTVCPAIPHCPTGSPIAVDDAEVPYWPAGIAFSSPFSAGRRARVGRTARPLPRRPADRHADRRHALERAAPLRGRPCAGAAHRRLPTPAGILKKRSCLAHYSIIDGLVDEGPEICE